MTATKTKYTFGFKPIIVLAFFVVMAASVNAVGTWCDTSQPYAINATTGLTLTNLSDFVSYLNLANAPATFFGNVSNVNGSDITIYDQNCVRLQTELVNINKTNNTGEMYVRVNLSATAVANNFIDIYFGNSIYAYLKDCSTWNSQFMAVYHMNELPNETLRDSTCRGFNITNRTNMGGADSVPSILGKGVQVNSRVSSQLLIMPNFTTLINNENLNRTLSVWAYPNKNDASRCILFSQVPSTSRYYICTDGAGSAAYALGSGSQQILGTLDVGSWQFYAVAQLSNTARGYKNSTQGAGYAYVNYSINEPLKIGGSGVGSDMFNGTVDEIHIEVARTGAWINTSVNNVVNSSFWTWGTVRNVPPEVPIVVIYEPQNTTYNHTNLNLNVTANKTVANWTYELNGATNVSFTPNTTLTAVEGNNNLVVYANSTGGLLGFSTVNFIVDTTAPVVTIQSPTNTTYNVDNITLSYSVVEANNRTCKYELNGAANISLPTCSNTTFHSPEGDNTVKVFATDGIGNVGYNNVSFFVHSEAPIVTIQSPTNTTYYTNFIDLNFSLIDMQVDQCWYILDGSANISLPGCANTTLVGITGGSHKIWVYVNDTPGFINSSNVNFTVFQGLNLSVYDANHTTIASWNVTITNGTGTVSFTGRNNPALFSFDALPQGNSTITVSKTAYDTESFTAIISNAMGIVKHDFTLYPFSYVYLYNPNTFSYVSNWQLEIKAPNGTTYINVAVPTYYTSSNRFLITGNNTIIVSASGVNTITTSVIVYNITGFNLTISSTQIIAKMWAIDELTTMKKGWNAQITLGSSNLTAIYVTGYRNGSAYCWDGDETESSACFGPISDGGINPHAGSTIVIVGQDYNNATYNFSYSSIIQGGSCDDVVAEVYGIDKNGAQNLLFTDSFQNTVGTIRRSGIVSVQNDNGVYNKAIAFNLSITQTRCGPLGNSVYITEFRMLTNTAGYTYLDDTTITLPTIFLGNYTRIIATFSGEETYNTQYTTQRDYFLTSSPLVDYNVIGYLLKDSGNGGYYQYFIVLDSNNQPIQGAQLTLGRWYSNVENVVAQCQTNAAGSCNFWMQTSQNLYSLRIQKSGYVTYYNESTKYIAGQGTAYIYLTTGGAVNFVSPFQGIDVHLIPTSNEYFNTALNTSCVAQAELGNMNWINYTVIQQTAFNNITLYGVIYTNSNPSGGTFQIPISANGQFQMRCEYEWVSNVTGNATIYRNFNSKTIWVFNDQMNNAWQTGGDDGWLGMIIALGIILIVCAPIALISPTYGMAVAIFLLLIFAWVGMIPTVLIAGHPVSGFMIAGLTILTVIALLFLRSFL